MEIQYVFIIYYVLTENFRSSSILPMTSSTLPSHPTAQG